jgi:hypothetical protein
MAKGNIISLNDGLYQYELPPEPRDEKTILNYNLPKKDQVWRREPVLDVKRMSVRERVEYIEKMDDYFLNGRWMLINGELIYLTGMNWDFLTLSKFEFGHPNYLYQQTLDFYFRDLVRKDSNCYGKAILKCRRCGLTTEEIQEVIYTLIEDENCNIGLQSNEHTKCVRTLLHPIIQAYITRPTWMRGKFYAPNGKKPRNALELVSNKVEVLNDETDSYLGGTVLAYPTVASAIDGYKKKLIVMDESFKWLGCSPEETLGINKKCVVEYGIKGKVDVLSTMGDSDDQIQSVKEGCKIIYDSNPRIRDLNGRTTSGLYEWFISAIHSADIPEEHRDPAYTKYGKVNKDSAEAYVRGEVNKHPANSKQRVFEMRRLPLEKKHGLMSAAERSYFPIIRIEDRLDVLNALPRDKKPYVRGNLEERANGKIEFVANELGIWLVSLHPYFSAERNIDTRNRFRVSREGRFFPPTNPEFVLGYDPIRYKTKNTTSKNLSLACIKVWKKFDYFNSGISNEYAALCLYRPDDPDEAHYECVKGCRYWGGPINAERQVESTENIFINNGMDSFLLKDAKGIWGVYTNPKVIENGVQKLVTKFAPPKTELDKDQISIYPFEDGLIDFKNFDASNTLESHVTMATIMCEYGAEQLIQTNLTDNSMSRMLKASLEIFPAVR